MHIYTYLHITMHILIFAYLKTFRDVTAGPLNTQTVQTNLLAFIFTLFELFGNDIQVLSSRLHLSKLRSPHWICTSHEHQSH